MAEAKTEPEVRTPDPPISLYFSVQIGAKEGSQDLGTFISCEGLALEVQTEDREEGGNNGFVHKLPLRIKYSNVKFTRPMGPDSAKVAQWFADMATGVTRSTARIAALTPAQKELCAWNLIGVIPVKWQGPTFSAESAKAAIETLEIAHHGFTLVWTG